VTVAALGFDGICRTISLAFKQKCSALLQALIDYINPQILDRKKICLSFAFLTFQDAALGQSETGLFG
jgi:hypothetical protein